MPKKKLHPQFRNLLVLMLIWLVGAVSDHLWFALDRSVPAWDQAEYLTGSLNYWRALQQPQWLEGEWWTNFWQLSTKVPPLTYIVTAIVQFVFGIGMDQATLVNLVFSAILLASVYGLGIQLFSAEVGLWAAAICQLLPALYRLRLDFLLDFPLASIVTLSFWCLTVWRYIATTEAQRTQRRGWLWAAVFGVSLGLALLVKQTALFFLLTPVLWAAGEAVCSRRWNRLCQLALGLLLAVAVCGPWYRTNWLLILTGGKRATVDSAIAEGDPALNTITAWTYYWQILPKQISWLLLLVPIVGLLLYWIRRGVGVRRQRGRGTEENINFPLHPSSLMWLLVFWVGAYLLCSLNINKDDRYVLPYLPVLSLFLAYGITCWYGRWGKQIRWGAIGLAIVLMLLNLFPIGGGLGNGIVQALSPDAKHYADWESEWPHTQMIDEIIQTAPYVNSTVGVLPSTPEVNQHNVNYYGALRNFQVYGRQVGTQKKQIFQDARSLDWFLTKTGNQGSVPAAQADIVQMVEQTGDFLLHKSWGLPDKSILKLYRHRTPQVWVKPLVGVRRRRLVGGFLQPLSAVQESEGALTISSERVTLSKVTVPPQAPPGKPVPVTYEWTGAWNQLQPGLVLLTWQNQTNPRDRWLHDHGIGMGTLIEDSGVAGLAPHFVIEQTAMLPPANLPAGIYNLQAVYLNRKTGETYPISVPPVTLKIDLSAPAVTAPELDLLTQQRTLAAALPKGPEALENIFAEVARINQYDPIQDYLVQAQLAMEYRLQQEPQNLEWAYTLALSNVLQQQVQGAIAALEHVTRLDPNNPFAHAYLAFVHLYNWNGAAAQAVLQPALAIKSDSLELQALNGIAALMQGNFIKAWQALSLVNSISR